MTDAVTHAHDAPYAPVFVGARRKELDELFTRYPTKMACLLPALWMVQEERGWVSEEAMAEVDYDYVRALSYGLPPTAGYGLGVDRVTMLMTGVRSIRDVILFPLLRPE